MILRIRSHVEIDLEVDGFSKSGMIEKISQEETKRLRENLIRTESKEVKIGKKSYRIGIISLFFTILGVILTLILSK